MAFENVTITSSVDGGAFVPGYREDLTGTSLVTLALSDTRGVSSVRWEVLGRPEGSNVGGPGPEPCLLGTSLQVSFQADRYLFGSYLIAATINAGGVNNARITTVLAKVSGATSFRKTLRIPAAQEVDEDTSDPTVNAGYAKALNRWLRYIFQLSNFTGYGAVPEDWRIGAASAGVFGTDVPDHVYMFGDEKNQPPSAFNVSMVANVITAVPFIVARRGFITDVLAPYTRGGLVGSPEVRWAIYDNWPGGVFPRNILWRSSAGNVFAAASGILTEAVLYPPAPPAPPGPPALVLLYPGLYWFATLLNANAVSSSAKLPKLDYYNAWPLGGVQYPLIYPSGFYMSRSPVPYGAFPLNPTPADPNSSDWGVYPAVGNLGHDLSTANIFPTPTAYFRWRNI